MSKYNEIPRVYLSKYKHPDVTKREIISVLAQYRDLSPSFDKFVFCDGSQKEMINLEGTIPVSYKGNTYNIPVCIWIMDTHPYNPPMVFVRPTSTMQIKPNRSVDANGKVDLPYLRGWKYGSSELLSLVQVLVFVFGEECPVFSRIVPDSSSQTTPKRVHMERQAENEKHKDENNGKRILQFQEEEEYIHAVSEEEHSRRYQSALNIYLSQYENKEVTRREIVTVLNKYHNMRPSFERFEFADGSQKRLLNLEGTIPVAYRGNTYNIPVCIWIMDTHPNDPPMAYVRPTSKMEIRPNRYVDKDGKIDLPYLRDWKYVPSDLPSLLQILGAVFEEECPLFPTKG